MKPKYPTETKGNQKEKKREKNKTRNEKTKIWNMDC
jgi:hypothetical protein